jgi:H+-transporting ATPase
MAAIAKANLMEGVGAESWPIKGGNQQKPNGIDLENSEVGLLPTEYLQNLARYGYNEVVFVKVPEWRKIVNRYLSLVPMIMTITAILSVAVKTECPASLTDEEIACDCTESRDWASFALLLFEINLVVWVDYFGEKGAAEASAKLKRAPEYPAKRGDDGKTIHEIPQRELVPGDIVNVQNGAIIPGDCVVIGSGSPLKISNAAVNGENDVLKKNTGERIFAGATVTAGDRWVYITGTGQYTLMGEVQQILASRPEKPGNIQIILSKVAKCIAAISSVACLIIFIVIVTSAAKDGNGISLTNTVVMAIKQAFVILVSTLPVAMPVVVTVGLAVGSKELAAQGAIVQKLSAIEELAGVDILCSDKTGTLTLNQLSIQDVYPIGSHTKEEVLLYSKLSSKDPGDGELEPIDRCITGVDPSSKEVQVKRLHKCSQCGQ